MMDKIATCPEGHKIVILGKDAHKPTIYCPECDAINARAENTRLQTLTAELEDYKNVVDELLVINFIGVAKGDPRTEIASIISLERRQALDPAISKDAAELVSLAGATKVVEGLGMCVIPRDELRQKIIQPCRLGGGFYCVVCGKWQWSREHSPNHEDNCWYGQAMLSAKGGG